MLEIWFLLLDCSSCDHSVVFMTKRKFLSNVASYVRSREPMCTRKPYQHEILIVVEEMARGVCAYGSIIYLSIRGLFDWHFSHRCLLEC